MSLSGVLAWFEDNLRGGAARLELREPPTSAALTAFTAAVGPVARLGWSLHDGQDVPRKKKPTVQGEPAKAKLAWLPGGYRWYSIDESLSVSNSRFLRFTDWKPGQRIKRVAWAGDFRTGGAIWVEANATVVFRESEDYGPGRVLAQSLDHFFEQYLHRLNSKRITWDATRKAMVFGKKQLLYAFG